MKILLVNPAQSDALASEASEAPRAATGPYPPLGLLYLQASLESEKNHQVDLLDENLAGKPGRLLDETARWPEPDLVGLTALTPNLVSVVRTIRIVKSIFPRTKIVVGGPHVELFAIETAALPAVDFALAGEAEHTMKKLADALQEGGPPRDLPGLITSEGGSAREQAGPVVIEDLDGLPMPDRSRLPVKKYRNLAGMAGTFTTMISSRGCPYGCTFCSTPKGAVRLRSPASVTEEMHRCQNAHIDHVYFVDDTFPIRKERINELCEDFAGAGSLPHWSCRTAAIGLGETILKKMKQAGCLRIQIGVETGTDEGLAALNKPTRLDAIRRTVARANRVGLETMAYFMIGLPHEKGPQDVEKTLHFSRKLSPTYAMYNVLTLYPGTQLYQDARNKGLVHGDPWRTFADNPKVGFSPPVWDAHLSRAQLSALQAKAYRTFYLRPAVVLRMLRAGGGGRALLKSVRAGLGMLRPTRFRKGGAHR